MKDKCPQTLAIERLIRASILSLSEVRKLAQESFSHKKCDENQCTLCEIESAIDQLESEKEEP